MKKKIYPFLFAIWFMLPVFSAEQPNILFIIGDDMGVDVLNGYKVGTNLPNTPNLDKLRAAGLTFNHVWAAPVCSATRASILTGKYGVNSGVNTVPGYLKPLEQASLFKEMDQYTNHAYQSCVVGKWHLGRLKNLDHPYLFGVDNFMGVMGAGVEDYYEWNKIENKQEETCTTYATTYLTDYASSWIKAQSKPWFMWLAHFAPHTPFHTPPSYMYSQKSTLTNAQKYLAMIESLDYEIGRLLDSIPQDVLDNTIILFLGDNGTPGNLVQTYPNKRGKQSIYQGGIHVPLIVSGRGVNRVGEHEDAMINVSDLYATIIQLTSPTALPNGKINDSYSFKHLLAGTEGVTRSYNYMELGANTNIPNNLYAATEGRYKLIEEVQGGQQFYDLEMDPYELSNLLETGLTDEQERIKTELEMKIASINGVNLCEDGIQNGNETGIDCGGDCAECEDTTTISPGSGGTSKYSIVHTGVTEFYGINSKIATPSNTDPLYWQDAGRIINTPSYTDNDDGTITDQVTGLTWEKNMGSKLSYSEAVAKANNLELGGYSDWRIPTIKELYSLILFTGKVKGETAITPFINTEYFDQPLGNTNIGEREIDAQTWSSTHYTGLTMNADSTVFGVNFIDGRIKGYPKYKPRTGEANKMYFRMVRGNADYGKNAFTDNGNGTVTDSATMLMWQQADDGVGRDWKSSIEYCEGLNLGDYDDWHLPNAKELQSIVDYTRSPMATNSAAIQAIFSASEIKDPDGNLGQYPNYWASTSHLDGANPYKNGVYISFGKSQGKMNGTLMDVHGAGAQRSDPKSGNAADYPKYFGPQGDVQLVYNHCRCVRNIPFASGTKAVDHQQVQIKLFPNPAKNALQVHMPFAVNHVWIKLYDINQRLISRSHVSGSVATMETSSLNPGVYIVVVESADRKIATQKFVKL